MSASYENKLVIQIYSKKLSFSGTKMICKLYTLKKWRIPIV